MKITAIKLENVRGFKSLEKTELSDTINVFIGSNNSGKSTVLNSIYMLQRNVLTTNDKTLGERNGEIFLYFKGKHQNIIDVDNALYKSIKFTLDNSQILFGDINDNSTHALGRIHESEPINLIYPYLSKRKVDSYNENINGSIANSITGNLSNLYSKIDRLIAPQFQPGNKEYIKACNEILGFEISTIAKGNGKHAVYYIHNLDHIPLTAMGEGVANILGLITDLCMAENKIFLIEEPENDIHPKALKSLMKLIIEKSKTNQFFISTHSNIVMKYLGSALNSKVFNITNNERDSIKDKLFISKMKEVENNPEDRRQILEDLGYDFFDFDLWKGWLFLEESSAEVIIRDYLIDWFVKPLKNKIRTFAAGGTSKVITKFEDFDKLFIFLHLEPTYKNKVWVLIDGGEQEEEIIKTMKKKYVNAGWNESNFTQFSEHDFEKYYPEEFQERVSQVLNIGNVQEKRKQKRELLNDVKNWINANEDKAKEKFKESAKDVIEKLKVISKQLNS